MYRYMILLITGGLVLQTNALAMAAPDSWGTCPYAFADVDGSGTTDVLDVVCGILAVTSGLVGAPPPACVSDGPIGADTDCNGKLSVADVQVTIATILGIPLGSFVDKLGDGCPNACTPYLPCTPEACEFGLSCSSGYCDTSTGDCSVSALPDGFPCTDGDACTYNDECDNGVCIPGMPPSYLEWIWANDSNPCTFAYCDPGYGMTSTIRLGECSYSSGYDFDPCGYGGVCMDGLCVLRVPEGKTCLSSATCVDSICAEDGCAPSTLGCSEIDPLRPLVTDGKWVGTGYVTHTHVRSSDLDGDGDSDLVRLSAGGTYLTVYRIGEEGDFADAPEKETLLDVEATDVLLGDADLDGDVDILPHTASAIRLLANVDGAFVPSSLLSVLERDFETSSSPVLLDVDSDSTPDIVWARGDAAELSLYRRESGVAGWTETVLPLSHAVQRLFVGEVDGDGADDVVVMHGSDGDSAVSILAGGATAGAAPSITAAPLAAGGWTEGTVGDVDADGDGDLVVISDDEVGWFENTSGDGSSWEHHPIGDVQANAVASLDLNGSGRDDIVVLDRFGQVHLFYSALDTVIEFQTVIHPRLVPYGRSIVVANLDTDGVSDFFIAPAAPENVGYSLWAAGFDSTLVWFHPEDPESYCCP